MKLFILTKALTHKINNTLIFNNPKFAHSPINRLSLDINNKRGSIMYITGEQPARPERPQDGDSYFAKPKPKKN